MAKGTCAYCAKSEVEIEVEHVFPESWYPDGFPPSEMLTVPSCRKCNGDYGRIEERLFLRLALSLPTGEPFDSITERAMRGAEAASGKSVRDVSFRHARGRSIMRSISIIGPNDSIDSAWTPSGRPVTDLVTEAGLLVHGTGVVEFGWKNLEALAFKFLRGCYFATQGAPLPQDADLWAQGFEQNPSELIAEWRRVQGNITRGGFPFWFSITSTTSSKDGRVLSGAHFVLWDHFALFAAANLPRARDDS
jgi:hypothetical protein